ncbi:hypothetical protein Droror1_Dr00007351 [Drosera rotundifolia]
MLNHRLLLRLRSVTTHSFTAPLHRTMSTTATTSPPLISPSTTRIGWIGTGVMGRSMCAHLLAAGYTVSVFNRTLSKAQPLLSLGATLSSSPAALASDSDIVFSIVGFPSDVASVTSAALSTLRPGSVLVDMTTSDPSLAASIAAKAAEKGCFSVDAPVSGGDKGAREGKLAIFAGGEEAVVERLKPVLELMGRVFYMGGPGKGQYAKLANQVTIASTMVGMVEGMTFARKAGLDVAAFIEAIATGGAGSKSIDLYGGRILRRDWEPGFYVDHFVKDLGICLKECQEMGLSLPGLALAQQLYLSLKAHGEGRLGTQALVLAIERLNNIELGSTPTKSE